MAGVFLSHSTLDKKLVFRLAVDLVAHGIPVWLDSWELDTGDSVNERIFAGIDDSTLFVVALSPHSAASRWVADELAAALAKEGRLGRKVILPIKLASCEAPLAIADRVYADFTSGYLKALEQLEGSLQRLGVDTANVPLERQMMPLVFSKGLYLERVALQEQYARFIPVLRAGGRILATQMIVAPDERLDQMRDVLLGTLEDLDKHPNYSPGLELQFRTLYEHVRKLEAALPAGIADIANGLVQMGDWAFFAEASHWYARMVRTELVARLAQSWAFARDDEPPLTTGGLDDFFSTSAGAAKFFTVETVAPYDIFRRDTNQYFRAWLDPSETGASFFHQMAHQSLLSLESPTLLYKFVVPQMVARHRFYSPSSTRLAWDLRDWTVGFA